MSEKQVEEVEAALDMLLWIENTYIKAVLVCVLLSLFGAVASYLMNAEAAVRFFVYFGTAVVWISGPVILYMVATDLWLVVRRAKLRGGLTRLDAALIATRMIYVVVLSVLFIALTVKILSLTWHRVE